MTTTQSLLAEQQRLIQATINMIRECDTLIQKTRETLDVKDTGSDTGGTDGSDGSNEPH